MARRRRPPDDPYDLTFPDDDADGESIDLAALRAEIATLRSTLTEVRGQVEQQSLALQRAEDDARDASDTRERLARAEEQLGTLRNERREQEPDRDLPVRLGQLEAAIQTLTGQVTAAVSAAQEAGQLVAGQARAVEQAGEVARGVEALARRLDQQGSERREAPAPAPDPRVDVLTEQVRSAETRAQAAERTAVEAQQLVAMQARAVEQASELTHRVDELAAHMARHVDLLATERTNPASLDPAVSAIHSALADQTKAAREAASQADARATSAERLAEQSAVRAQSAEDAGRGVEAVLRSVDELRAAFGTEAERRAAEERSRTEQWDRFTAGVTERAARSEQIALDARSEARAAANTAAKAADEVAAVAQTTQATTTDTLLSAIGGKLSDLAQFLQSDQVLGTMWSWKGLQIPDAAIVAVDAGKMTSGDLAAARLITNLIAAFNATAGGADAAKVTTGDLPQAQMQTNAGAAVNAGATAINGSKVTGALDSTVTLGGDKLTGDLVLGSGQKIGVFGSTAVVQQTRAAVTNNITSGGTADTYADWDASGGTPVNDLLPAIRNNSYQMAEAIRTVIANLRTYGFFG